LDVGAATFGVIDIVRAERRGELSEIQLTRALAIWTVGTADSAVSYVPGTVGAIFGTASEAVFFEAQVYNLTGQLNPFHGW